MSDLNYKYIVTIDNPYYPNIYYCATLKEAKNKADEILNDVFSFDGQYDVKICVAKLINVRATKTNY